MSSVSGRPSTTQKRAARLRALTILALLCSAPVHTSAHAQERPTLLIGGEDDRVVQLGDAPQVIVTQRHILLIERKPPLVRVLRRDGTLRQTFGRLGAGPGEFGADVVARYDSSTRQVVLFDHSNARLSYFALGDSLTFLRSVAIDVSPFDGCMVNGVPWQTVPGTKFLQRLDLVGGRLRPSRSIGAVRWFDPVAKDPALARYIGQVMLACDPGRQWALLAPSSIGEAHLVSLRDGRQHHLRVDNYRPMRVERFGQLDIITRIPDDGVYDMVHGLLTTPQGLELVVGRHTPWVKGREDVVTYRRVLVSEGGTQRVVAQGRWRPLAIESDGAYCFTADPAPTLARFASGRCP